MYVRILLVSLCIRGAWIEIRNIYHVFFVFVSLCIRGAWIEMLTTLVIYPPTSRSAYAERGLKYRLPVVDNNKMCRSAYAERGLK